MTLGDAQADWSVQEDTSTVTPNDSQSHQDAADCRKIQSASDFYSWLAGVESNLDDVREKEDV